MEKREDLIKALGRPKMFDMENITGSLAMCTKPGMRGCDDCSYRDQKDCVGNLMRDALELLEEKEREINSLGKSLWDATELLRKVKHR